MDHLQSEAVVFEKGLRAAAAAVVRVLVPRQAHRLST